MITFDEFKKAEIKIGTILSAEKIPEADKLIKLMIDLGLKPSASGADGSPDHSLVANGLGTKETPSVAVVVPADETEPVVSEEVSATQDIRQILSGIAEHYPDPSVLVGKQVPVLVNLPTRTIRGYESQGMVLYAVGEGFLTTVGPDHEIPAGTNVQ